MNVEVLTRPDEKIMLMCPNGHPMFETGVLVKTLYKGHGIRIRTNQLVRETNVSLSSNNSF